MHVVRIRTYAYVVRVRVRVRVRVSVHVCHGMRLHCAVLCCAVLCCAARRSKRTATLREDDTRHLLLQSTTNAARCAPLIFQLFNQLQRHAATHLLAAY